MFRFCDCADAVCFWLDWSLALWGVGPVLIRWSIFHITYNVYKTRKLGKSSHGYCLSWLCVLGPKSNLMILFQPRCGRSKGPLSQPVDSSPWTSFWSWFAVHKAMCVFLDSTFGRFNLFALSFILSSGVPDTSNLRFPNQTFKGTVPCLLHLSIAKPGAMWAYSSRVFIALYFAILVLFAHSKENYLVHLRGLQNLLRYRKNS